MKAYRVHRWQSKATLEDVAVPEPGPGQVLIKIAGAGVCSSDLHIVHEWSPETVPQVAGWRLPFTLGHENGGWVEGGDTTLAAGTPVVVNSFVELWSMPTVSDGCDELLRSQRSERQQRWDGS